MTLQIFWGLKQIPHPAWVGFDGHSAKILKSKKKTAVIGWELVPSTRYRGWLRHSSGIKRAGKRAGKRARQESHPPAYLDLHIGTLSNNE